MITEKQEFQFYIGNDIIKDKEIVKKQVNLWEINELKKKIYQINEMEMIIKINSKNSLNLVSDFVVNY